ncbi:MAG TPA: DinB family protein [Flavobacteriales bacterium]|nr:DinB family protein [Flavobacteriales bacterium]
MSMITRPRPGDYPDQYHAYLSAARGEGLAEALEHAGGEELRTRALVPDNKWEYRYAPGKWTTQEVFQHIIDIERVFAYRALCIARNEKADLPGMDEDAYQAESRAGRRDIDDIMRELKAVRSATIELFASFDAEALSKAGTANGKHITVPALGWIIAGHSEHHLRIIRERYLG